MSTSLLYHAFGLRGYRHVRTDYPEGEVVLTIAQEREKLHCPVCGSAEVTAHGGVTRLFRTVPIGRKASYVWASHTGPARHFVAIARCGAEDV